MMIQCVKKGIWLVTVLAMALAITPIAMSAEYLKIGGIKGEVTEEGHVGEIDVLGWEWGVQTRSASSNGGGTYRTGVSEITITKKADSTSPSLRQSSSTGKRYPEITITTVGVGGKSNVMQLKNAVITAVRPVGSGNENVVFRFEKLKVQPKALK